MSEERLRSEIFRIVKKIFDIRSSEERFRPGVDMIRYAAAVYDEEEIISMIDAILDGWFGVSKRARRFEYEFSRFLGVKRTVITNSGSSANLLSVSALLSSQLDEDERLKPGDEVITPALTFPTTLNPILQNDLVPVFLDVDLETYNIRAEDLDEALSEKTRVILVPHTLGNPNEMDAICDFADEHGLFLIEDSCDALGSKYDGRYVGSFGAFGTFSFYPAHQITMGEGGAVTTNNKRFADIALSLRDWGRACVMPICDPMRCSDGECPKAVRGGRKESPHGLPEDYDKRYTYVNVGYNLKPTEIQAAMGLAQLRKLPKFIEARKRNFNLLYEEMLAYEDFFVLPKSLPKSEPCWFAFPLTIREDAPFTRREIVDWLTRRRIEVKMIFAGNILRHPAYTSIRFRLAQDLANSDSIMRNSFFIGVYPGLTEEKIGYMIDELKRFIRRSH
jgi:CDP-6-deoxy-D-xylo-4-hexulose-3-dehydrase